MNTQLERKIIAILTKKNLSVWQIFETLDSGEKETLEALKNLEKKRLIVTGKTIKLNQTNKKNFKIKKNYLDSSDKKFFSKFNQLTSHINPLKKEYYQERVSVKDIIKKLKFMDKREDLFGANIVFLGDDDFCSIAAMLTKKPKSITVLEIDTHVINNIKKISKNFSKREYPKINCVQFDLSKKIPNKLKNKFDVFVCEPPESSTGMETFISKGLALLKGNGCAGYVGLTRLESSGKKWHSLQKKLVNSNAFVSDVIRQFEQYPLFAEDIIEFEQTPLFKKMFFETGKPNAPWWKSSLVRIELINKPKTLIPKKGNFYHDEETLSVSPTIGQ